MLDSSSQSFVKAAPCLTRNHTFPEIAVINFKEYINVGSGETPFHQPAAMFPPFAQRP